MFEMIMGFRPFDLVGRLATPGFLQRVDAMDAKQPLASDLALGGDGSFPQTAPSMNPTSNFGSPVVGGGCGCPVAIGWAKQNVVDILGVRLHEAAKALEQLARSKLQRKSMGSIPTKTSTP